MKQAFGLVCSSASQSAYDGKLAYVPALEDILVWDVKKGEMVGSLLRSELDEVDRSLPHSLQLAMWHEIGCRTEVTCLVKGPKDDGVFAAGYADGSIRLWSASTGTVTVTFNGHKKAVTSLAFDHDGVRLASGSQDTDLIVWDIVSETGLFRYAL